MTWVRLDEEFPDHPKVAAAGPLAAWLHVCALAYCNRYLTDGFVPAGQVAKLADFSGLRVKVGDLAGRLVDVDLWEAAEGGYRVHDFHDYQPSRAAVEADRRSKQEAKSRAGRAGAAARWSKGKAPPPMAQPMAQPMANGMAQPMAGGMAERRHRGSHSDGPVSVPQEHSSRLPVTHDPAVAASAPGGAGEEKTLVRRPGDPFVERIVAVVGDQPKHRRQASRLVAHAMTVLDPRLVDEAIGRCEGADIPPRTVGFFETTMDRTATAYGVSWPSIPATSERA